jgi:hypothetical protein
VAWRANGGFSNVAKDAEQGKKNKHRERLWFSPSCLVAKTAEASMFEEAAA